MLSVTVDEAFTYNRFVSGGFAGVFLSGFDANNHVLHSALAWLSISAFGIYAFSLRIPALFGGAVFLWYACKLVERLVPLPWQRVLLFLVLALNPLTLDLLCVARGYSLALGFLCAALHHLLAYSDRMQQRDLLWMSAALGLSCASNLSFAFVTIAVVVVAAALAMHRGRTMHLPAILWPGAALAAAILILPLSRSERGSFYFGAQTIRSSAETTGDTFLLHNPEHPGPLGSAKTRGRFARRFLPAALAFLMIAIGVWFLRGAHRHLTLLAGVLITALGGYWIANEWLGIPYPSERTGMGVAFLFFLCLGGAAARLRTYEWNWWAFGVPLCGAFALLLAQFAIPFDPGYVWSWYDERDNHEMVEFLESRGVRTVSAHWLFQPALEFYRASGRLKSVQPVETQRGDLPALQGHDAYVLLRAEAPVLEQNGLRIAWRSRARNVFVAMPAGR